MAHLDGTGLHRVHHAEGRNQFTGRVHRHIEFATGHGLDRLCEHVGRAVDGVQRLGEAGSQAPAKGSLGMHRRRGTGGEHAGDTGVLDEGTTIHLLQLRGLYCLSRSWAAGAVEATEF